MNRAQPPTPEDRSAVNRQFMQHAHALGVPRDYGRARGLRRMREPARLASVGLDTQGREQFLVPHAARAWARMRDAAAHDGVELQIVSAFRSIEYQLGIIRRKRERGQSIEAILRVSAAPGYSEHHSGRAIDITTPGFTPLEEEFERSAASKWLRKNARLYRFSLSYPRNNPHGIAYEPWHWCWHSTLKSR